MTLSENALSKISTPSSHVKIDADIDRIQKNTNDRKREVYWIGFLEGALSSDRIESGEEEAILAEAEKFVEFLRPGCVGPGRGHSGEMFFRPE